MYNRTAHPWSNTTNFFVDFILPLKCETKLKLLLIAPFYIIHLPFFPFALCVFAFLQFVAERQPYINHGSRMYGFKVYSR